MFKIFDTLKSLALNFLSKSADYLSLKALIKLANKKILLPFYHTVSNETLPHINNLYRFKNVTEFKNDLDFLTKYYKSVSVDEVVNSKVFNLKIEKPIFHLSFDDGLNEIRNVIAPILLERGIHATFFINSDFIDNKNLFYRFKVSLIIDELKKNIPIEVEKKLEMVLESEPSSFRTKLLSLTWNDILLIDEVGYLLNIDFDEYLKRKPYLSSDDVIWLSKKGFSIGAHSENHPRYKDISLLDQIKQTNGSLRYLEDNLNIKSKLFAFPFSDDGVTLDYFNDVNLIPNYSFGTSGLLDDIVVSNLQRIPLELYNLNSETIIKAHYLKYILKKIYKRNMINR